MINVVDNKYKDAFEKAREIAQLLGKTKSMEGLRTDVQYISEFEYENLKIVYDYSNDVLTITIDNGIFGMCNFITNKMSYYPSKWPELINIIHSRLPEIVVKKKEYEEDKAETKNQLKELTPSFQEYIILYNEGEKAQSILNKHLKFDDIEVKKAVYSNGKKLFQLYSYNKEKITFEDDYYNPIPDYDKASDVLMNDDSDREWMYYFQRDVRWSKEDYEAFLKKETNNNIDKLIRRLK